MKNSFLPIILTFCLFLPGCENKKLYRDTQILMGTFVEVTSPDKRAKQIVFAEIKRIEELLSNYKDSSEVARLNKSGHLKVSPETFFIIKKSKEIWQMSNGAFDITVAPLVKLWGFKDNKFSVPQAQKIKEALRYIGSDKIILNEKDSVVEFKLPGIQIDLGAIAKGFAVDCAIKKLRESEIKNCLINAGGQIYGLGGKFGLPWKIAVRNPNENTFFDYLYIKDRAVSTSGNYEQCFNFKGIRYGHIFNPKTGYPVEPEFASVTVVAPSGLIADALTTSIFVLGKEEGKKLINKFKDVELITIDK